MLKLAQGFGKVMTIVSTTLMLILCLPITYEAVMRSFNAPTIWVFETTLYAFIFLGFLGNSLAVKSGAHFRVTILAEAIPALRPFLDRLAQWATLLFALMVIASGIYFMGYSISNGIVSATLLEIPLWIPQAAIPLGGLGLLLQTCVQMATGESGSDEMMVGD